LVNLFNLFKSLSDLLNLFDSLVHLLYRLKSLVNLLDFFFYIADRCNTLNFFCVLSFEFLNTSLKSKYDLTSLVFTLFGQDIASLLVIAHYVFELQIFDVSCHHKTKSDKLVLIGLRCTFKQLGHLHLLKKFLGWFNILKEFRIQLQNYFDLLDCIDSDLNITDWFN
jgi:hypothetical protein